MRTTVNIDDDLRRRLRLEADRSRMSCRETLHRALDAGLERLRPAGKRPAYRCSTFALAQPATGDLDRALQIAGTMEDDEVIRKPPLRK